MNQVIKKQAILPRIDGILKDIDKLRHLALLPFDQFRAADQENFALAQFYLRQALEGVFHIGEHILSRLNGGRATEYKQIAQKLGEYNLVNHSFAENNLKKMAGYRNRLTHFYADVTPEEIYKVIKENLSDFSVFLEAIKGILENPEKLGLKVE